MLPDHKGDKAVINHDKMFEKTRKKSPSVGIEKNMPRFKKLEKEPENNKLEVDDAWKKS